MMAKRPNKISSILDIARYKMGDMPWWVVFRSEAPPTIAPDDAWMTEHHPKELYMRGPFRNLLPSHVRPPRLGHNDFDFVTTLICADLAVEQFVVCDIKRSNDSGEFFYRNSHGEWMPESYLMDSRAAANRERTRILRMIKTWTNKS